MTKTSKLLTSAALMVALVVGSTAAYAQDGDAGQKRQQVKNPELHAQVMEAMDNRDYDAWASILSEDERGVKILEHINADNFGTFVDMKEAFQNKDIETAKELKEQLGLPDMPHKFNKHNKKGHFGPKDPEKREALKETMEAGDYNAWAALLTEDGREAKILEHINADNFGTFVEMTEAMKNHDFEIAKALHEDLGLPMPPKGGNNNPQGQGFGNFNGPFNGQNQDSKPEQL